MSTASDTSYVPLLLSGGVGHPTHRSDRNGQTSLLNFPTAVSEASVFRDMDAEGLGFLSGGILAIASLLGVNTFFGLRKRELSFSSSQEVCEGAMISV